MGIRRQCFGENICWVGDRGYVLHSNVAVLAGFLQLVAPYAHVLATYGFTWFVDILTAALHRRGSVSFSRRG